MSPCVSDSTSDSLCFIVISWWNSFIGFYSGFTWYISLDHTPLPPNTAIYQTAPVFVFIISVPTLGEKVSILPTLFPRSSRVQRLISCMYAFMSLWTAMVMHDNHWRVAGVCLHERGR